MDRAGLISRWAILRKVPVNARSDGHRLRPHPRSWLQILAPLLRPTFGGALALMFILLSHEFAASLLVRAPTVNVMGTILYDYYENGGYPLVAVISLIMVGVTTAGVIVALILGGSESFKKL